jgi:hypothetical protein
MRTLATIILLGLGAVAGYTAYYMQKSVLDITPRDVKHTWQENAPTIVYK